MHLTSLVVLVLVRFFGAYGRASAAPPDASGGGTDRVRADKPGQLPVSVLCSIEGRFSKGNAWSLVVKPDGAARLFIEHYPRSQRRVFVVSAAQRAELARVVEVERFFALADRYGDQVPDGSTRTLTITRGNRSKTMTLGYLRREDAKLPEIKRAVRVWNAVRKWFDDAEAVDLSAYDQRLLNAP